MNQAVGGGKVFSGDLQGTTEIYVGAAQPPEAHDYGADLSRIRALQPLNSIPITAAIITTSETMPPAAARVSTRTDGRISDPPDDLVFLNQHLHHN